MPKSTYEYYKERKHLIAEQKKKSKDDEILSIVKPIYEENKARYGYRRIILSIDKDTLRKLSVGRDRIRKVLINNGLYGIQGSNHKYHSYKGDNGLEKRNLLLIKEFDKEKDKEVLVRDFKTTGPNQKWTTDVSEFKTSCGKLYLSPILDMYDSSIISYDLSMHPDFSQTKRMISEAFSKYNNLEGLIFHSDQGWQYQMKQYSSWLSERKIKQSFSRKGNCMDNSLMENFFGILKNEMFYGHEHEFKTLEDLKEAIEEYIDYYNAKRINVKRKGLSPLMYRQQSQTLLQCI
jgi:transposase InsO family protein